MSKINIITLIFLLLNSHIHAGGRGKDNNQKQVFRGAIKSICTDGLKAIDQYRADRKPSNNTSPGYNFVIPTSCRNSGVVVLKIGTCPDNTMRSQTKDEKLDKFKEDLHKACECGFEDGCEKKLQFVIKEGNNTKKITIAYPASLGFGQTNIMLKRFVLG